MIGKYRLKTTSELIQENLWNFQTEKPIGISGSLERYNHKMLGKNLESQADFSCKMEQPIFIEGICFYSKHYCVNEEYNNKLIGRYLKARSNNPQNTTYKKGDYAQIVKIINNEGSICELDNSQYYYSTNCRAKEWELMPKEFDPKISKNNYCNGDWVRIYFKEINFEFYGKINYISEDFIYFKEFINCDLNTYEFNKTLNFSKNIIKEMIPVPFYNIHIQKLLPEYHIQKIKRDHISCNNSGSLTPYEGVIISNPRGEIKTEEFKKNNLTLKKKEKSSLKNQNFYIKSVKLNSKNKK